MTFAAFSTLVRRQCFEEGEAEELVSRHENRIRDGLTDLQMRVPGLQVNHTDVTAGENTWFHCGSSKVELPRGNIKAVWTYPDLDYCKRADYTAIPWAQMECLIQQANARCFCATYNAPYTDYEAYGETYYYPDGPQLGDQTMNEGANRACRARQGQMALYRGYLYLFPSVQTTESVVVEWDGIKRNWVDADSSDMLDDREVQQAIENYLTGSAAMDDDDDPKRAEVYLSDNWPAAGKYQKNARDMLLRWRDSQTLPVPPPYCFRCG